MISNHEIPKILKNDNGAATKALFGEALSDVVLFDGDVKTQHITVLAEVAKAFDALQENKSYFKSRDNVIYMKKDIPTFIYQHREELQQLTGQFMELGESSLFKIMDNLGKALYEEHWIVKKDIKEIANNSIILYKGKNGELAIRFPSHEKREEFYHNLEHTQIPEQYRKGIQYAENQNGYVPFIFNKQENRLFFPSYQARNGEFAINCGSPNNRELLIKLLGLKVSSTKKYDYDLATLYADGLFTTYSNSQQLNTIYFNEKNEVFIKPGVFLKIDTSTGNTIQCQVENYSSTIDTNDRFSMSNAVIFHSNSTHSDAITVQPDSTNENHTVSKVPTAPQVQSKNATLKVVSNQQNGLELEVQFSDATICDQWYKQFIGIANCLDVSINSNFLEKSSNTSIKIKGSLGKGNLGVYESKPTSSEHFQPAPQLAINFIEPQLRDYFFKSMNLDNSEAFTFPDNSIRKGAVYFKPEKLSAQPNKTLQKELNEGYIANCAGFVSSEEEISTANNFNV